MMRKTDEAALEKEEKKGFKDVLVVLKDTRQERNIRFSTRREQLAHVDCF